jgi:hypothetical protein
MPVGGGDLSAMVRWDGSLHLHLTKSDAWGFQSPQDAPAGSRFFNNVSPGHVRLIFGPGARAAASQRFEQRLDVAGGRVTLRLGSASIEVRGDPQRKVLVIELSDPKQASAIPLSCRVAPGNEGEGSPMGCLRARSRPGPLVLTWPTPVWRTFSTSLPILYWDAGWA